MLLFAPPQHWRSSAEISAVLQTQACILHGGSTSHGPGWGKATASLRNGADKAELLFLSWEHLPGTAPSEEQEAELPLPHHRSSPAPHSQNPHQEQHFPLLQTKEAVAAPCRVFAVPARLLSSAVACSAHVLSHLKEGGECPRSMVNSILSRTGAIKTLKVL